MASTWLSAEDEDRILDLWPAAPTETPELLGMLLDVARVQVLAYAAADDAPALQVSELLTVLAVPAETIEEVLTVLAFEEYPVGVPVVTIPDRYVYAQLQQARNLWAAGTVSGEGSIGADGFTYTPRPLDKTIRGIIRPTTGAASVF